MFYAQKYFILLTAFDPWLLFSSPVLSADDDENAMLGCLFKGATFYIPKPISMNDLKNLWQFSNIKKHEETVDLEGPTFCEERSPPYSSSSDCISLSSALEQNAQKGKRKELEEMERDNALENGNSAVPKKPKLIWTNELHHKFLQAIRTMDIDSENFDSKIPKVY